MVGNLEPTRLWAPITYNTVTKHIFRSPGALQKFNILAANMQINSNEIRYLRIHCMSTNKIDANIF